MSAVNFWKKIWLLVALLIFSRAVLALDRTNEVFKVFQFPPNMIPTIDGKTNDWDIVPDSYAIGAEQLVDDMHNHTYDPNHLKARVKVGWVKGLNRLYFLYEADKAYWDFSQPDLHNDTLEVVVDGSLSGGPLIADFATNEDLLGQWGAYMALQGTHAQNYHIFTPAESKDWCMYWGPQQWLKDLPYANHAYNYTFRPGQPGHLVTEFWITPFDYAAAEGPAESKETVLTENKIIGLSWVVIDYNDPNSGGTNYGFWNLSRHHRMYGNADYLCQFKLMPLEQPFQKAAGAYWTYQVVDMDRRQVAFKDQSAGRIVTWHWDFGDGLTSTNQNPIHSYKAAGRYIVILDTDSLEGGQSRFSRVWDVTLK